LRDSAARVGVNRPGEARHDLGIDTILAEIAQRPEHRAGRLASGVTHDDGLRPTAVVIERPELCFRSAPHGKGLRWANSPKLELLKI
jgi:hypothetical protein